MKKTKQKKAKQGAVKQIVASNNFVNVKPQIAIFGLGRMGGQIARRLHKNNFTVFAWNRSEKPVKEIKQAGIAASQNIEDVVKHFTAKQRIFWVMLPHAIVDDFLFGKDALAPHLRKGDIV